LNGTPGPAHLLELKDEVPLSAEQVAQIEAAYAAMRERAIAQGQQLIERERALDDAFRNRTVTEESLRRMLAEIEESRTELRFTHLATHLLTPSILTDAQIERYNTLRGYAQDPCASVPPGHDPTLWRHHNGCS
jgi:hypothetical protein